MLSMRSSTTVVPGELRLGIGEFLVVAHREVLERRLVRGDEFRQLFDAGALERRNDQHGNVGAGRMQEVDVALHVFGRKEVGLVEHHEVGLFQLQLQQIHQLFGQVDVGAFGHDHAQALRVDHHGEGRERELVRVVGGQAVVYVVERADAASGDVAHHEHRPVLVAQAADLVDGVVHLIADAARGDFGHRAARRLREVRVHQVGTQVVGYDGRLAEGLVHVLGERDHRGGLAGAQKAAHHHETYLVHDPSFGSHSIRRFSGSRR